MTHEPMTVATTCSACASDACVWQTPPEIGIHTHVITRRLDRFQDQKLPRVLAAYLNSSPATIIFVLFFSVGRTNACRRNKVDDNRSITRVTSERSILQASRVLPNPSSLWTNATLFLTCEIPSGSYPRSFAKLNSSLGAFLEYVTRTDDAFERVLWCYL